MSIQEILTAGGGTLIVLLTLVQIAPIKLNPWSAIVKWIGHALNAEVLEKQQETQKKLDEHIRVDDERNANLLRTQILRFNDELIDDKHHTREHFIEVLAIIDGEKATFGTPVVEGATVTGKIIKTGKSKKIRVYKMKPKKNYRRTQGHRQPYTKVEITAINA